MWLTVTPELPVADVRASQQFYRDVLGCRIGWLAPDERYGAIYVETHEVFLAQRAEPRAAVTLCVRVDDVEVTLAAYREAGAEIVDDLEQKPWAMREFSIRDLDGHLLRIGESTLGAPTLVASDDAG